ncbi:MAG: rod shape-determining protein MreD [Firmicutes bacterium]|nr:rod shape-determining protein MreD [Bacillota bacterium]
MRLRSISISILAFLLLCLEATVMQRIRLAGVVPNLSVCVVVSAALLYGSAFGRRLGLAVGLIQDLLFMRFTGFFGLLFFLAGHIAGQFKDGFEQNNLFMALSITALIDFAFSAVCYLLLHFFQGRINVMDYFRDLILPELIYTMLAALPVYLLVRAVGIISDRITERKRHNVTEGNMSVDVRSAPYN